MNLTEWLITTDENKTAESVDNDQQDTALDLAASLLVGMTNFYIVNRRLSTNFQNKQEKNLFFFRSTRLG